MSSYYYKAQVMLSQREAKGGRTRRSDLESQKYLLLREEVWSGNILKGGGGKKRGRNREEMEESRN